MVENLTFLLSIWRHLYITTPRYNDSLVPVPRGVVIKRFHCIQGVPKKKRPLQTDFLKKFKWLEVALLVSKLFFLCLNFLTFCENFEIIWLPIREIFLPPYHHHRSPPPCHHHQPTTTIVSKFLLFLFHFSKSIFLRSVFFHHI